MESEDENAHIKQCGSILKQCIRCKAYVERRHFDSHNRLCSKSLSEVRIQPQNINNNNSNSGPNVLYPQEVNISNAKINPQQNENIYYTPTTQNGPANAYLVNSQPYIYTATESNGSNSPLLRLNERNVYTYANKPPDSPTREGEQKFYKAPEYSSLDRNDHGGNNVLMRDRLPFNSRPMSVINADADLMQYMRSELALLRNYLNEEQIQREKLTNEINKLRKHYMLSEERNQILLATITTLRNNIEDESEKYKATYSLLGGEIDSLRNKNEVLLKKVSQVETVMSDLQKDMEREQVDRSHLDLIVNAQDNKLRILNRLESNLETLKNETDQEQQIRKDVISNVQKEIVQLKESFSIEISKQKQQLHTIEENQTNIIEQLKANADDLSKYSVLNKESKALMGIVEEDTKKIQGLEEKFKSLSNSVAALQKQRFTNHLENNVSVNTTEIVDKSGHLMWKITNFEEKLKDSIDNESVLLSPIFYSTKYGYALQGELCLNGLGKWKGRHITASVFVIPGKWDPLLAWPVRMTAKIILRDQATKTAQAVHIVKSLQVRKRDHRDDIKLLIKSSAPRSDEKRKSTENLSTAEKEARALEASIKKQYIFISHSSLDKFDYIKNNIMFVEIITENA